MQWYLDDASIAALNGRILTPAHLQHIDTQHEAATRAHGGTPSVGGRNAHPGLRASDHLHAAAARVSRRRREDTERRCHHHFGCEGTLAGRTAGHPARQADGPSFHGQRNARGTRCAEAARAETTREASRSPGQ
eukprot:5093645-Prymnesium_polylepis.1